MTEDLPVIGVVALAAACVTALVLLTVLLLGGPWAAGPAALLVALGAGLGAAALAPRVCAGWTEPDNVEPAQLVPVTPVQTREDADL